MGETPNGLSANTKYESRRDFVSQASPDFRARSRPMSEPPNYVSRNAVSFSICTHVSARPLRHQTHRELVYRPLQFHKRSQLFLGTHHKTLSIAMGVGNPDSSPPAILSETFGTTQFGDGWPQRSQLQPGAPSLGRCVTLLPVTFCTLCLGDLLS